MELQHGELQRPLCDVYNPEPTHSTEASPETQQVGGCCKIPHCVGPRQVKVIGNSGITKAGTEESLRSLCSSETGTR